MSKNEPPQRRRSTALILGTWIGLLGLPTGDNAQGQAPRIQVGANHRFLVNEDGSPYFYLGDTAWELFHRLDRENAITYLDDRASKGFTVIQAVAIAELDGDTVPNPYGHLPFEDRYPTHPAVGDGPEDDYWDHVDFIVREANARGLLIGFLPTWGRYWHDGEEGTRLFNPENARTYGEWLGRRYADAGLIWVLGGDRTVDTEEQRATIVAMAEGLKAGDDGAHLMTFHPRGGSGSAEVFHDEPWLDFNMRQNGHTAQFTGHYDKTRLDYDRQPPKPVIDGEPLYEDHPIEFNARENGHSTATDVRRPLYWDLFSGACGHTYGHHSIWQMWTPDRPPVNDPLVPWDVAIGRPGGSQMQHARHLLESRPYLDRIPDDSILVPDRVKTAVPGAGRYRYVATRDEAGTYAMVYCPLGRPFSVRMDAISGPTLKAWWFDPRTGAAEPIGEFPNTGTREFNTPTPGEATDWVLVLDDASKGYPPPGQVASP